MALTKKDLKFIDRYMTHGNGSQAMRESGFAGKRPDQAAYENLRKPEIKHEIERRTSLLIGHPEVIRRIAERGRATMADVIRIRRLKPTEGEGSEGAVQATLAGDDSWQLDLLKAEATGGIHQIKKLKEGKYGVEIELYDPLPALEILAKYLKITGDDGGVLKYIDLTKLSPEQLQRLADGDDPLAVILNTTSDSGQGGA